MNDNTVEAVEQQEDTTTPTVEQQESTEPEQATENSTEPVVANLVKQVESLRHEAAQYRTERNAARELLTAARRQLLVTNEKTAHFLVPSAVEDVLSGFVDVDAMFDDSGNLDQKKYETTLQELVDDKRYFRNPKLDEVPDLIRQLHEGRDFRYIHRKGSTDPLKDALTR